jgi:putative ABC transport system substrate-binding protein
MQRRKFITLIGGAAAAWPLAARAQQTQSVRRIGMLLAFTEDVERPNILAFRQKLKDLGWIEGHDLTIDVRFAHGNYEQMAADAGLFVNANVDIIFAQGTPGLLSVRKHTTITPVVFVLVADPVGQGLIANLAHPGSHATGFTNFEFSIGGKWLDIIRELDSRLNHITTIANPGNPTARHFAEFIEATGRTNAIEVTTANVHNAPEIEAAISKCAEKANGGLIILPDSLPVVHGDLIMGLATRHRLPSVYPFGVFARRGGLISYGIDFPNLYGQAAVYVDRILRGAKPADLPVQAPNKFELIINLSTAKALGLTVPLSLLARTDEVIE